MRECDVAVIGSGPGGYVAAIRAAQRGAKVICFEREHLGGVCLNVGCIPTKTLIYSASLFHKMQHAADYGLQAEKVAFDLPALVARKNKVVGLNTGGIDGLFKAHGIEVIEGDARVVARGVVRSGGEEVRAKAIIIATGGRPAQLPGLELNGKTVIGSTDALELTELPAHIAVIGAGAIGAEFASLWQRFGAKITLIEAMPFVLPREDQDISKRIGASFKKRGMDVRTGTTVAKLETQGAGVRLTLEGAKPGVVEADLVLVGIGLECNSEVLSEMAGAKVALGPRGAIVVNERMETSVPDIYAIGDVINKTWLAHGASTEAIAAATNATGGNKTMDYRVLPSCTFTSPEVASVGMTEEAAREAGIQVKTGQYLFAGLGRAHAMNETEGLVKIVGDAETDEVLGVHIMGAEAGELIATGALAMRLEATIEELVETIHTHPTLAEALHEAAEDFYGESIHTRPRRR